MAVIGGITHRSGQRRAPTAPAGAVEEIGGVTRTNGAGSVRLSWAERTGGGAAGAAAEGGPDCDDGEATVAGREDDFDDGGVKTRLPVGGGRVAAVAGAFAEEGSSGGATAG